MTGRAEEAEARDPDAGRFGLWLFLSTEVMMFGALFLAIALARIGHGGPAPFDKGLAAVNTAILLTSSLLVALAGEGGTHPPGSGRTRWSPRWSLGGAALLGLVFLGVKAVEYRADVAKGVLPGPDRLVNLYYLATGLHAIHLTIGVLLLAGLALSRPLPERVELAGLYWHFVDLVWVFLYPALYLLPA